MTRTTPGITGTGIITQVAAILVVNLVSGAGYSCSQGVQVTRSVNLGMNPVPTGWAG